MLMQRDFDLNSVQKSADSKEEVIKQTMVKQDITFRNQVHELHRLYGVQKSLMKDLSGTDDDWYNPWNRIQSFVPAVRNKYEPLVKESISFSATKVNPSSYMSQELLNSFQGTCFRLQKRPLNLQLSADEFIKLDKDNLPKRGKFVNFLKGAEDSRHLISVDNPSDAEDLNLSPLIGIDRTTAGGMTTNWFNKKVHSSPPIVIDLEDSEDNVSHVYTKCTTLDSATPQSNSKGKLDFHVPYLSGARISNRVNASLSCQDTRNSSCRQEFSECFHGQRNKGTKECSNDVSPTNLSIEVKQPSFRGYVLDLNRVQTDESSYYSDDPIFTSLSAACSFGNQAESNDNPKKGSFPDLCNWKHETSNTVPADKVVNPAAENFDINNGSINSWAKNTAYSRTKGSMAGLKIPDLMSLPPLGTSDNRSCCDDDRNDDVDQKMKVQSDFSPNSDHVSAVTTPRAGSCGGSEADDTIFSCIDQSQNTCQDGHGIKSPASVKSYPVSDNDSTNSKTKHSGIKSGVSNQFSETESGTLMSDVLSGGHDIQNSVRTESKSECNKNEGETYQVDVLMETAAESLLQMYLDKASAQDLRREMESKETENYQKQKPECSADSYEMITLNLKEDVDSNSATSNAYDVNYEETKDFGLKLRRGRRMKNFQREILPGLASLARHEICEDINIMEGALRSREYRKMRAKTAASGQKWSTPVRSRRSRLNYVRRRIFA